MLTCCSQPLFVSVCYVHCILSDPLCSPDPVILVISICIELLFSCGLRSKISVGAVCCCCAVVDLTCCVFCSLFLVALRVCSP